MNVRLKINIDNLHELFRHRLFQPLNYQAKESYKRYEGSTTHNLGGYLFMILSFLKFYERPNHNSV